MARVPISFYLNVLAGVLVLFNHYASSETGDVAFNKITGAIDRFSTLFRDAALTLQYGCASHLEMILCGPALDSVLPHDTAEHLKMRYCYVPPQNSDSGTINAQQPHGGYGYGSSDVAFVHDKALMWPSRPPTLAKGLLGQPHVSFDGSSQLQRHRRLSQAVWERSSEAVTTIGLHALRTCASWWWFRAPFTTTGVLLAVYAALLALESLFGTGVALQSVFQVYVAAVADFLQCIQWEAQRLIPDVGVSMMARAYR